MIRALPLLLLLFLPQGEFTEFRFCREGPRPDVPSYCLSLGPDGSGRFVSRTGDRDMEEPMAMSEGAAQKLAALLEATDYLADGARYESGRNVANLGRKTLAVYGAWGSREAEFNYSSIPEVNTLLAFLDRIIAQELLRLDVDFALEFDPLSLPGLLDRIQSELRADRIADPVGLRSILRRVADDRRVVNYARQTSEQLLKEIEDD